MSPRRFLRVALGSLLAVALAVPLAGTASASGSAPAVVARPVKGPVDASKLSGNESETAVAVNPTDPDNVVIVFEPRVGSGLVRVLYSTDGGATWTTNVIANGGELGHACCDGTLSWDEFGNLFLGYLSDDNFNVVPVAVSVDGGRTFRLVQNVDPGLNPRRHATAINRRGIEGSGVDQPTLVAGEGMLWVVWNGGAMKASGAAVTGLGQIGAFSPAQVAPGTSGCSFGDAAIGPQGQVMQVCQNPTGGQGPATIYGNVDPHGLGAAGFGGGSRSPRRTSVGSTSSRVVLALGRRRGGARPGTGPVARVTDGCTWSTRTRSGPRATTPTSSCGSPTTTARPGPTGYGRTTTPPRTASSTRRSPSTTRPGTSRSRSTTAASTRATAGTATRTAPRTTTRTSSGMFSTNGGSLFLPNLRISRGMSNDNQAQNGIDYGDYTGLDFYAGSAHPAWADNSTAPATTPTGRSTSSTCTRPGSASRAEVRARGIVETREAFEFAQWTRSV